MIGNKITPFKFWCQKVLPTVYDDSLSYYELLNKVVEYLNTVIEQMNTLTESEEEFQTNLTAVWEEYKTYIDNYFDNLDVQNEINNKLDAMASDGSLDELIKPFVETEVASNIDEVVGEQIDGSVASQINGSVASQIGNVVNEQMGEVAPSIITTWLNTYVDPVGSAVTVDSSLTITGSAADAKVVGDDINLINDTFNKYVFGTNIFTDTTKTEGRAYRPSTHDYQTNSAYGTCSLAVKSSHTYRVYGISTTYNPFGYCINNISGSRISDEVITGNFDVTMPSNAGSMTFTYLLTDETNIYIVDLSDLQSTLNDYLSNKDYIDNIQRNKITLKGISETIDGYDYFAFCGASPFNEKEVFAIRGSYEHTARPTINGKVYLFKSDDGNVFTHNALSIDNSEIGGELRDINLCQTRSGEYLLMSGFTNDNAVTEHIYSYLFVLNSSFEIVKRIQIGSDGFICWGNTVETEDEYLLKCGYDLSNNIYIYKSSTTVSDIGNMTFTLVTTLTSGTNISEPTLFYTPSKLVCFTRGDSTSSVIFETSDLSGETGWSSAISVGVTFHSPYALPYYNSNVVNLAVGYWLNDSIRIPAMVWYDTGTRSVKHLSAIDDTLTHAGGYPAFVKRNESEYDVMYYDDNGSNTATALYVKKYNPYMAKNTMYFL